MLFIRIVLSLSLGSFREIYTKFSDFIALIEERSRCRGCSFQLNLFGVSLGGCGNEAKI